MAFEVPPHNRARRTPRPASSPARFRRKRQFSCPSAPPPRSRRSRRETLEILGSRRTGAEIILANTYHSLPPPGPRAHPAHGRRPQLHELAAANAYRFRRLPGLLARQAAQNQRRRRRVPLAPRRLQTLLLARALHRGPDRAQAPTSPWSSTSASSTPATWERTRASMDLTHRWRRALRRLLPRARPRSPLAWRAWRPDAKPVRHRPGRHAPGPPQGVGRNPRCDGPARLRHRRPRRRRAARSHPRHHRAKRSNGSPKTSRATSWASATRMRLRNTPAWAST